MLKEYSISSADVSERIRRTCKFIEDNPTEHLSISALSKIAAMSNYHFSREFVRETGKTPVRYVIERRVLLAVSLLERTDYRMSDIAMATGFGSQSHFATTFRLHTGMTPLRYRSNHKNKSLDGTRAVRDCPELDRVGID